MKKLILTISLALFLAACGTDDDLSLNSTAYDVTITSEAKNPPNAQIPNELYLPTDEKRMLVLRFSEDQQTVAMEPGGVSGFLTGSGANNRVYELDQGLFAGGRLDIDNTGEGLVSTYTEFGSGVPVISSSRGPSRYLDSVRLWQSFAIVWQHSAILWQAFATLWQDLAIRPPNRKPRNPMHEPPFQSTHWRRHRVGLWNRLPWPIKALIHLLVLYFITGSASTTVPILGVLLSGYP